MTDGHGQKYIGKQKRHQQLERGEAASYRTERAGRWAAGKKKIRQTAKKTEE